LAASHPLYAAARREEAKQDHVAEDMKQVASHNEGQLTDTKLSAEQLEELVKTPAGVISPRRANMRADLGNGEPQSPEVCTRLRQHIVGNTHSTIIESKYGV